LVRADKTQQRTIRNSLEKFGVSVLDTSQNAIAANKRPSVVGHGYGEKFSNETINPTAIIPHFSILYFDK
jgi:hypothetical protein